MGKGVVSFGLGIPPERGQGGHTGTLRLEGLPGAVGCQAPCPANGLELSSPGFALTDPSRSTGRVSQPAVLGRPCGEASWVPAAGLKKVKGLEENDPMGNWSL